MVGVRIFLSWKLKRYFRHIVYGAIATVAAVNLVLHVGAGLQYFCEEECTVRLFRGKISPYNKYLVEHVRDYMIDPPAPRGSYKSNFDVSNPPWAKLGGWGRVYKTINDYFKPYDKPGRFVEIGAQDGEFLSLTLHLEQNLNFTGLLIEPHPRDYKKLRSRQRSSYSINACASPRGIPSKEMLWLRHNSGNLPPMLQRVQDGSNRLYTYVAKEDRDLGVLEPVHCLPVETMALAAFGSQVIDLLTISTHGGELDILNSLYSKIRIRVLVMMVPLANQEELDFMKTNAERLQLTLVFTEGNIYVFLPQTEVQTVKP